MNPKSLWRGEDGAAAVELAVLAPVLAIVLGGAVQLATLAQTAVIASNAAREGARYAAVSDPSAATKAASYASSSLGSRNDVAIGSVTVTSAGLGSTVTVDVPVTVTITMPVMSRLLGSTVTLNGGATMRVTQ